MKLAVCRRCKCYANVSLFAAQACCCTCSQYLSPWPDALPGGSSARGSDASKALDSGAARALQAGKTTAYQEHTHLFLGKQPLGLSMEGDQHDLSASWPPGGMVSQQWPGSGLCCWQQDGAALAVETHIVGPPHSHPVYLPTLSRQWQDQCSWLHLLLCLVSLARGTLYSEHGYAVQRLKHLLDAFCIPGA